VTGGFEFLEHTADIGIRARGGSREEAFRASGEGLARLMGIWFPREGEERNVQAEGPDLEALLVAWLDELIFLHESEGAGFGEVRVDRVGERLVDARVRLAPIGGRQVEGVGVKAATYHRVRVFEEDGDWVAEVFLDV
jgi:SHS2 domain-containing protein